MITLATLIATVFSAILYRLGGMSKQEAKRFPPWKWFPEWMVDSKSRDIGCALISMTWFGLLFHFPAGVESWKIVLAYAVGFFGTFGALTTYWDFISGDDNFYLHGFAIGFAKILFAAFSGMWLAWGIQCVICAVAMGLISRFSKNDYVEECGRGAAMPISQLPMVLM